MTDIIGSPHFPMLIGPAAILRSAWKGEGPAVSREPPTARLPRPPPRGAARAPHPDDVVDDLLDVPLDDRVRRVHLP